MDQRERYFDAAETFRMALEAWQARIWTAMPCVVTAFPAASGLGPMLLDAQPLINGRALNAQGTFDSIQMPQVLDVPILWQGGGKATFTFPIKAGDECLVIFAARCIDAWWQLGVGASNTPGRDPPDQRMHNLSDGFAIVGLRSLPRSFAVNQNFAILVNDAQDTFVAMDPIGKVVKLTAPNGINLNGVAIDSSGNVTSPATITAATDVKVGSVTLKTHTHTDPQGGTVGPPQG